MAAGPGIPLSRMSTNKTSDAVSQNLDANLRLEVRNLVDS